MIDEMTRYSLTRWYQTYKKKELVLFQSLTRFVFNGRWYQTYKKKELVQFQSLTRLVFNGSPLPLLFALNLGFWSDKRQWITNYTIFNYSDNIVLIDLFRSVPKYSKVDSAVHMIDLPEIITLTEAITGMGVCFWYNDFGVASCPFGWTSVSYDWSMIFKATINQS